MLPRFIAKDAVNSFWFYDYDRQGWVTNDYQGHGPVYEPAEPAPGHTDLMISPEAIDEALATEERSSLSVPPEPTLRRRI